MEWQVHTPAPSTASSPPRGQVLSAGADRVIAGLCWEHSDRRPPFPSLPRLQLPSWHLKGLKLWEQLKGIISTWTWNFIMAIADKMFLPELTVGIGTVAENAILWVCLRGVCAGWVKTFCSLTEEACKIPSTVPARLHTVVGISCPLPSPPSSLNLS